MNIWGKSIVFDLGNAGTFSKKERAIGLCLCLAWIRAYVWSKWSWFKMKKMQEKRSLTYEIYNYCGS